MRLIRSFLSDENGATAIEYGLIAALIGSALVGGMGLYGTELGNLFNYAARTMTNGMNQAQ